MAELFTLEEVDAFISSHEFSFLYISRDNCSVCHALLPKVKEMLKKFPKIELAYINADRLPEISGRLSVFTVPALLLFVEGKEYIREARFVRLRELENKIATLIELRG